MENAPVARRGTYIGLGLVTLSTLMYEILLTRIFSVTMWYHYAFAAISIAMFGMTVGALVVYLWPSFFLPARVKSQMGLSALLFSLMMVSSFTIHLFIPLRDLNASSPAALGFLTLNYSVISVPFVFGGICVCLALTRFPRQVSRLYAVDLAGAGTGCVLLIPALRLTDGPTCVFLVAFLASLGSIAFLWESKERRLLLGAGCFSTFLLVFTIGHTFLVQSQKPLLTLRWVKGEWEPRPIYEKWNSFSRIQVIGYPDKPRPPQGWGLSSTLPESDWVCQLTIEIDSQAGTWMTRYHGDPEPLDHLRFDIINLVHYLRKDARVLVVGVGGGRDLLSALAFGQREIVGVEINNDIIRILNETFGDYSGHLDGDPRIVFVDDEARSWISRQQERFDIIQVSFIDTWAATAAGAFVLTENSLYTVEAWATFLDRLSPDGILTFSRWYVPENPAEIYRLLHLGAAALQRIGISNPRDHLLLATHPCDPRNLIGVGTLLLSKQPLSSETVDAFERASEDLLFDVQLTPTKAADPVLAKILSPEKAGDFMAEYPLDLSAPTDDRPFFFNMLRFGDLFSPRTFVKQGPNEPNIRAVAVLGSLLAITLLLTLLFILGPLFVTTDRSALSGKKTLFILFAAIGVGFMLVEISQMQRLIVFLGHPTYGLSVVLFSLLLSSGAGSYLVHPVGNAKRQGVILFLLLISALGGVGGFTPLVVSAFRGAETPVRIGIAVGILCFPGFFMGMPFPLGMKIASGQSPSLTPWLWGINGAASVCASVLAVAVSLWWGISATFWLGVACYVLATIAFWIASRQPALREDLCRSSRSRSRPPDRSDIPVVRKPRVVSSRSPTDSCGHPSHERLSTAERRWAEIGLVKFRACSMGGQRRWGREAGWCLRQAVRSDRRSDRCRSARSNRTCRRGSYPVILLTLESEVQPFQETPHLAHRENSYQLNPVVETQDLEFFPRTDIHPLSHFFRNNNLIFGRNRYCFHVDL